MITRLPDDEEVLADEMANLWRGWESVGGRIYVTDRRVIFESHWLNFRRGVTKIPIDDIEDVRPCNNLGFVPNGMEILTRDGRRFSFVTWARQSLMELIFYQLNSPRREDLRPEPRPDAGPPDERTTRGRP